MKAKDISDLRNKTVVELTKMAADLGVEINKVRMSQATHKNKNTNIASNLKRKLAIILSISSEIKLYVKS